MIRGRLKAALDDLFTQGVSEGWWSTAGAGRFTVELPKHEGMGDFSTNFALVVAGPVALLGDAAGYVDALTGEGLALAFGQAGDLAAAVAAGDLAAYARAHRRRVVLPHAVTRLALVAQARPVLRRRVIRALRDDPVLFTRLLGVLDGALSPAGVGALRTLRFLGRLAHA